MKPTAYELETYRGRCREESKSPDYCGSCSLAIHVAQMRDPASWVHSSEKFWVDAYPVMIARQRLIDAQDAYDAALAVHANTHNSEHERA